MNLIIYISTSQWLSHEIAQNSSVAYDSIIWQVIPFTNTEAMHDYIMQHNLIEMNPTEELPDEII